MASFDDDLFDVFDENVELINIDIPIKKVEPALIVIDDDDEDEVSINTSAKRGNKDSDDSRIPKEKKKKNSLNFDDMLPRIIVLTVETLEMCTHEVAVPPDVKYIPLVQPQGKPAKEYKFILDPFQKEAILCIDNNQSVLVSAHTSAGKTVVAEYSIAQSLKNKQRVIYTTPIKALSNQKYREFQEEFQDVGLVTGDVTLNMTASCLVMTTEILRNMLYRGSQLMREVGWVVFDEIHYMRDKERGVVWEETLILLPDNVHYVFLSATIPNARQFAEWVAYLHKQPCHVVYTDYRPVPLQHYIFPSGGDGIHLVVDEKGIFKEENFNTAMAVIHNTGDEPEGDYYRRRSSKKPIGEESDIFKLVKMIMERQFAPVIIFSFSKHDCETNAKNLSKLDLNTMEEKPLVSEVFNNAIDVLNKQDRELPQVQNILPLLLKGIGIHHGGLLPILKETVEILFGEGLIKALFATETFSMGLNMPARTVLFTSQRKFDGKKFRWITSGEYIQMSGRAGRRGLDKRGIVILMMDELVRPEVGRDIITGLPDPINSAFHLTYNMVLNLLRVEGINPEYMLERSFFQFQNQSSIPALLNKIEYKREKIITFSIKQESKIATYYNFWQEHEKLVKEFRQFITKPLYLEPFIQPGRLVKIKNGNDDFDWGVIINFKKYYNDSTRKNPKLKYTEITITFVIDMFLHLAGSIDSLGNSKIEESMKPCSANQTGYPEIVTVRHNLITSISSVRINLPKDLQTMDNRRLFLNKLQELKRNINDQVPILNPFTDMNINDPEFIEIVDKLDSLEVQMIEHPSHGDGDLSHRLQEYSKKAEVLQQLKIDKEDLQRAKSILQMDELKNRKRILRRMGYCTSADLIELKGRVACELSSADELLLTEMLFNGMFNKLTVAQILALLSCFVCDEKSKEMSELSEVLSEPLRQMQNMARRIAEISVESHLDISEEEYVVKFKPTLMDVVYAWCNGASFFKICQMTDIFEGSIIRALRRLEEVLRQMCQAAKNIGNTELENKFSEGIRLIKRDIVFAASLYL